MSFDQQAFNSFILNENVIGFFPQPIKLVSGRTSYWYVNWRTVMHDAFLLNTISDNLLSFIKAKKIKGTCFYGVPDGTTKLATICQYKYIQSRNDWKKGKYVFAMARKTPKDHGEPKDRFFVGQPKGDVIVIEDVTTTGESLLKHVKILQGFGVNVTAAITLTNRNELRDDGKSVAQELESINVPYYCLSQACDLLPQAVKMKKVSSVIKKSILSEFKTYGERQIVL